MGRLPHEPAEEPVTTNRVDYGELESRLRALLVSVGALLTDSDIVQFAESLEHGEYRLSLTWIAHSLVDGEAPVSVADRQEIIDLAIVMGIISDVPAEIERNSSFGNGARPERTVVAGPFVEQVYAGLVNLLPVL